MAQASREMSPAGYAEMSGLMGKSPEFAIFRRFGALNAQNLLYLQAELTGLEKKLKEHELDDQCSDTGFRSVYSRDWETLASSCDLHSGAENDPKQWQTFMAIRAKLKEYSMAFETLSPELLY
jgi:hypothetical protein